MCACACGYCACTNDFRTNTLFFDIYGQPDISAPGVGILAGYPPILPPSGLHGQDKRSVKYNLMTGTSVACAHTAGAAAYVKSFHPDWSPSSVKSALLTTGNLELSLGMISQFAHRY